VKDKRALAMRDPDQPGMQISNILDLSPTGFRQWPAILRKKSNMRGEILEPEDSDYDKPESFAHAV